MKDKIRWGIIGCGDVTEVKSGPGFQKAEGSELLAVMRRNGDLAKDYADRHGVLKWYDDAERLINDPDVDAVYVATPPSSHMEYTLAAAKAGKPVYVEKPMAMNYDQCKKMDEACGKAGVKLFVAYYRRGLPRFTKVKSLIDDGAIGEIRYVNTRLYEPPQTKEKYDDNNWRVDPDTAGCGYFCDLGSHMIDLIQYFAGNIKKAAGFSSNQGKEYKAEDTVSASFIFDSGAQGTGSWCFNSAGEIDKTEIIGTKGSITYSNFTEEAVILKAGGRIEEFVIPHPQHVQQPLIQSVVNELLGKGRSPSTGITALMTARIMDEILGRI